MSAMDERTVEAKDFGERVRRQLDRMLASATFQQADRLRRFLRFVVLEAIAGRRDELKEYIVGVQVFDKEPSFDPRTDPVVRVQARRLRARLSRYYAEEGERDEIIIDLPKGGYAPVFSQREESAPPASRPSPMKQAGRNTVVVIPFNDISPRGELGHYCKGIHEEIVHRLAMMPNLRVLALDPSRQGSAGRKQEAAIVVSGSLRVSGNTLRATAQISDETTGCYLWSDSVDGNMDEVFALQDRVAGLIAKRLESERFEYTPAKTPRRATVNLTAHNLYRQGRYHLSQRTEEGLLRAVDLFEKVLAEDAEFALAHSGLSDAYSLLGHYGVLGPAEVWTKTAAAAATAVMLHGNSAEARASLAHVKSTQDWDWRGSEMEFQRSIALDESYATAHHWYAASCLAPTGRLDEALEHMLLAQSLDPISSIIARDVARIHYYRRDFEAALEQCDYTVELNPHFAAVYQMLGMVQEQRGEFDEAIAAFERAAHLSPASPNSRAGLARTLAISGKRRLALRILRQLETLSAERYVSPFEFALVHLALDQVEPGLKWLEKACDDRCFELLTVKVDPRFDHLKDHPVVLSIIDRMGLGPGTQPKRGPEAGGGK